MREEEYKCQMKSNLLRTWKMWGNCSAGKLFREDY